MECTTLMVWFGHLGIFDKVVCISLTAANECVSTRLWMTRREIRRVVMSFFLFNLRMDEWKSIDGAIVDFIQGYSDGRLL